MALQAETLVEEWFNRNGYFTIRGIKDTIDEIDIVAIKNVGLNQWECVHCEVQVSVRPVGYISKLTEELVQELGVRKNTSAKLRTEENIELCAKEWVTKKFTNPKKKKIRNQLVMNTNWRYMFVYGNVKDSRELFYISKEEVKLIAFKDILNDLRSKNTAFEFVGSSAGDLVEIINFMDE